LSLDWREPVRTPAQELLAQFHRHRRVLAGAAAGLVVAAGMAWLRPARVPTVAVVVASSQLASGAVLTAADLRVETLPAADAPPGSTGDPALLDGRRLAQSVPPGVPVTAAALAGPAGVKPGLVEDAVPLADQADVHELTVGDSVDVLVARPDGSRAAVAAAGVPVLALPQSDGTGAVVVVAVTPAEARALAAAEAVDRISLVVEPPE
jgi:pilus assembly protein CpaB